jgi:AcrR family transcriptional regulator
MPRIVDHHQRRADVVEAATNVLVTRGRAALTVRSVAGEVGCSTTVVSHYFADMNELLFATYSAAATRARARLERVAAADPADLRGTIEAVLPLDTVRRRDWAVWFSFWSEALTTPRFAADQRERARGTVERVAGILQLLRADGSVGADVDIDVAAARLGALIAGIAGQAMFDPAHWTARRQRAVLAAELDLLGVRPA